MLYNAWSRLILALRRRRGLSQRAAAARAGVALTTWWRWEKGEASPRPGQLGTIAKALGRSPQRLGREYSRLLYRHYCRQEAGGEAGSAETPRPGEGSGRDRERSDPCSD